jgi:dienelactone hydrolase
MKAQAYEYDGGGVASLGYLALPDQQGKRPGILVVHEAPGLDTHPKRRAEMLAELGYVALAADLYGMGVVGNGPEEAFALMGPLREDPDRLRGRVRAGLNALAAVSAVEETQLGAIGFCFGGMSVLELARSGAPVAGVVAFHGLLETKRIAARSDIKGKVLVCTGGADPLVPAEQVDRFRKEMVEAGADVQIIIYGDAKHSVTNTAAETVPLPGFGYSQLADKRSWSAMQSFFKEIFEA